MEKQHLKRFGYGFSALVMGLAAVNFFPLSGGVYATTGGDFCTEEEPSPCFVLVTDPEVDEDPEYEDFYYEIGQTSPLTIKGEFNGDLVAYVDGKPVAEGSLVTEGRHFTLNLEFDTPGEHSLSLNISQDPTGKDSNFDYSIWVDVSNYDSDYTEKVAKIGEAFLVNAGASSEYTASKFDADGHAVKAGEDELEIKQSGEQFSVMPLKAGEYEVNFRGFVKVDGEWVDKWTRVGLTVFDTVTEAAGTVADVIEANYGSREIAYAAQEEYWRILEEHGHDEEDEEVIAAREEMEKIWDEQMREANLRIVNAFGEDAGAILSAAYAGQTISTDVSAAELDEADVEEEVKDALLANLDVTFASNVKFYDIDVNVYADGEYVGTLKELTSTQVIVLSGFEGPAAGFNRIFKVLGYHTYMDAEGNEQVEIVEIDDVIFDEESGSIIFGADKFSTYAVAYKDELAASVNTGVFTGEGSSATASIATSVVAAVVAVALFGAFKFAKKH